MNQLKEKGARGAFKGLGKGVACAVFLAMGIGGALGALPKYLITYDWPTGYGLPLSGVYEYDEQYGRYDEMTGYGSIKWSTYSQKWSCFYGENGIGPSQESQGDPDNPMEPMRWRTSWRDHFDIYHYTYYPCPQVYAMEAIDTSNPDPDAALTVDPINTISGAMVLDETDVAIRCPGVSLVLQRHYNSTLTDTNGVFGRGWTHTLGWSVEETTNTTTVGSTTITNDCLDVHTGGGTTYQLIQYGTNEVWESYRDVNWRAEKLTNGTYRLDIPPATRRFFDTNGVMTAVSDLNGNEVQLSYTNISGTLRLESAEHSSGKSLAFSYTGGNLTRVDTPDSGLYVLYGFTGSGKLTNATVHTTGRSFGTSYAYDADGHSLTQRVNAAGQVMSYSYATNGTGDVTSRCIGMVLGTNYYEHTVAYQTNDQYSAVTYARGDTNLVHENHYDTNIWRITESYGPGGSDVVHRLDYDSTYLNVTNEIFSDSSVDSNEYLRITRTFDNYHNVLSESLGYRCAPTDTWSFEWDADYQLPTSIEDPEGVETIMSYTNGLLAKSYIDVSGTRVGETTIAYTTNGLVSAVTNANGHWTHYYSDSSGNVTSVVPQSGPWVNMAYTELGHVSAIETLPWTYVADEPGSTNGYWTNRVISIDNNELGWPEEVTWPDGKNEAFLYDGLGNVTSHTDRAGRTVTMAYEPGGHLSSVTRTLGSGASGVDVTVSMDYDNQLNTLNIEDARGRAVESYALDEQDRPETVTNLEGQTMTIIYGVGSVVKSVSRFDGTSVTNTHDSQARVTGVSYPDSTTTFSYLKNGLLDGASNENGEVSVFYDGANRLDSSEFSSGDLTLEVDYGLDLVGSVTNRTVTAGTQTLSTVYSLDAAERVSGMDTPAGHFSFAYSTNNGLLAGIVCTNTGFSVTNLHDSMDRITDITWLNSSTQTVAGFSYQFDDADLVSSVTRDTGEVITYGYDSLDRLISETQKDAFGRAFLEQSIEHDLVGNRTNKLSNGVGLSYSYSDGNRLSGWSVTNATLDLVVDVVGHANETIGSGERYGQLWVSNTVAVTPSSDGTNFWVYGLPVQQGTQQVVAAICDEAGNTVFTTNSIQISIVTNCGILYDDAGNTTNMTYTGADYTNRLDLAWNGRYELTEVKTNGTVAETHGYDALGRRCWTASAGETNWYVWDASGHVTAEVDSDGDLIRSYVHAPGVDRLLAMTVHTGSVDVSYYYITDVLGSVHAIVNSDGDVVESVRYDAWGRITGLYGRGGAPIERSEIGNAYYWQGRHYSANTGLYFFRSRYYSPVEGRWLSKDRIGIAGGLDQYVAFGNSPVMFVDPDGMLYDWFSQMGTAGASRGGVLGGVQMNLAAVGTAVSDTVGGRVVEGAFSRSGSAAGEGRTGAAVAWGTAGGAYGVFSAFTFGRLGQGVKPLAAGFRNFRLYELGSRPFPNAVFGLTQGMGNAARGGELVRIFGSQQAVVALSSSTPLLTRLGVYLTTSPTPAGYLLGQLPAVVGVNAFGDDYLGSGFPMEGACD